VNSCWMCDYGRLNFHDLQSDRRLRDPQIRKGSEFQNATWKAAIDTAAMQLKQFSGAQIAILASGRMTNEEMWLTSQLARALGVASIDIVPRFGPSDDILLSADRNPNTNGARLMRLTGEPGARLEHIRAGIATGQVKALLALGENPLDGGITTEQLATLPVFIAMNLLSDESTPHASVMLPSSGFSEKRGSMINGKGRLQRLNRATRPPGDAHDDWEILRDLILAISGNNGIYTIEDVFRQMSEAVSEFRGLSLSKIGDLGTPLLEVNQSPSAPGEPAPEKVKEREMQKHPQ
jgi:NADH-quinone oxidoreductase subunit G